MRLPQWNDPVNQGGLAMKAIMRWGGGIAATLLFASVSFGQNWVTPVLKMPFPQNPDACGPGYYVMNGCGAWYGPNYWIRPPYAPFNGILPGPKGQCIQAAQAGVPPWVYAPNGVPNFPSAPNIANPNMAYPNMPNPNMQTPKPGQPTVGIYPTHPYVRSPRDFFMWSDDMHDSRGRDMRPNRVVP
jgi:hypothetical protein